MRALLLFAALLTPLLTPLAAHADELRVGVQKVGSLIVLRRDGTLEKALASKGITVRFVEFQAGPPLMEALNAGAIDIGYTGDSPPVFALAGDVKLVYVASQPNGGDNQGILVRADSPYKAVGELAGKRVAVTKGSSAHFQVFSVLKAANMSLTDVRPTYLAPADGRAALASSRVDAWAIWDPFLASAEQDPTFRLLSDGVPSNNFLIARRDYAAAHPDVVATVVRTANDAAAWGETHKPELAQLMSDVTGVALPAEQVSSARGSYRWLPMGDAVIAQEQRVADAFYALHVIPVQVDIRGATWTAPQGAQP